MSHVITIGTPILAVLITGLFSLLAIWMKGNYDRQFLELQRATEAADLAAERSKPTSNGFAASTAASLARIEGRLDTHGKAIGDLNRSLIAHLQETDHG